MFLIFRRVRIISIAVPITDNTIRAMYNYFTPLILRNFSCHFNS